jgi:hypothetical protein
MIRLIICGCLGFVLAWTPATVRADVWLTEHEARLLQALGQDVVVNGKALKLPADTTKLKSIGEQAPTPLRGHILALAKAYDEMKMTEEEQKEFDDLMKKGAEEIQKELGVGLLGALFGENPWDVSVGMTNRIMRNGTVTKAWDLQAKVLTRGVQARAKADAELKKITDAFESRIGKKRPAEDIPFRVVVEKEQLYIDAKVQGKATLPVVQLTIHKNSTGGKWTGLNAASGGLLKLIGVSEMNIPKGTALAIAQERAMNLPMQSTMLLPSLESGDTVRFSFALPARALLGIERIEAKVWSGEGYFSVSQIGGFDAAKFEVVRLMDMEQRYAQAKAMKNPFGLNFLLPSSTQRTSFPKPEASEVLYPGSVWRGTYVQKQPKANPLPVELIIDARDDKYFTGQLLQGGRHFHFVRGDLVGEKIRFAHDPKVKDQKPIPLHTGSLKDTQIDVAYNGVVGNVRASGTITLDYVPPKK